MNFRYRIPVPVACLLTLAACAHVGSGNPATPSPSVATGNCASDAGIALPPGFCATVFAEVAGRARYVTVAPNGDVYVAIDGTRPRRPGDPTTTPAFVALRDSNRDGRADVIERVSQNGNTGILLHGGYLYVDEGERIVRYPRQTGQLIPSTPAQVVVDRIPLNPGHRSRNFVIAPGNVLYVNVGSPSNSCQVKDRTTESPGKDPCDELSTRAGIWKFSSTALNQQFSPAARYATGVRNGTGMAMGKDSRLYAMTHGRDQLTQNWPRIFPDTSYNDENPAETLLQVNAGDDFGWPYCYYAVDQKRNVTAPEYGGEGKTAARCANVKAPLALFPAHWAPLDMMFYGGAAFPSRYRDGAFISFHGSWNRSRGVQAGGKIVFQPMTNGVASGPFEIFADGFAGVPPEEIAPDKAKHRPVGLAAGPDGAMYVTDDVGGRIYRITYGAQR